MITSWGDGMTERNAGVTTIPPGTVTVEDVQVARAEGVAKPKPCPFCGGAGTPIEWVAEDRTTGGMMLMWHVIECIECGANGPERTDPDSALAGWNTRTK
jgi:Lar family restriction alleviation protein